MKFKNSEIEKWKTTYEKSIWKNPVWIYRFENRYTLQKSFLILFLN